MKFNKFHSFVFCLIFFGFLFNFRYSFAETDINGDEISSDTTWTADAGPYIVYQSPTVDAGATLTIETGTIIKFDYDQTLNISGKLDAEGSIDNKIIFTSLYDTGDGNSTAYYGDWHGIKISTGGSYDLENTEIEYAGTAILSNNAAGTIDSAEIAHNQYGIILQNNSTADIQNINMDDILSDGIILQASVASIKSSDIKNSAGGGIEAVYGSSVDFTNSSMENVSSFSFLLYRTSTSSIQNSQINDSAGMQIYANSHLDFENSKMKNISGAAVDMDSSSANINNSTFDSIDSAVEIFDASAINIVNSMITNILSIGKAAFSIYTSSKANIVNSDIENIAGVGAEIYGGSTLNFSSSTLKYLGKQAFQAYMNNQGTTATTVTITSSTISDGESNGLEIYRDVNLDIKNSKISDFLGDGMQVYSDPIAINISESVISGNNNGIETWGDFPQIFAENNWWGDPSGPFNTDSNASGTANSVSDNVDFIPWLTSLPGAKPSCCSNVLFIPGLEGSRLYTNGLLSENQLWEPNWNNDVEKLYMDSDGNSIDQNIYTRDIIKRTNIGLGIFDINVYQSFSNAMDNLVSDKKINAWEAVPYDWRLDINTIIASGTLLEDGSKLNIVDELIKLAKTSETGKVTIVTHSNGGLIAKALINELKNRGEDDLVDDIIMVAAPELGTPSAVAGMLHGDGQEIAGGFILSKITARTLGENMMGAYNLLPQAEYFSKVSTPVIEFDPSVDKIANFRAKYGDEINTFTGLKDFLLGADGRADMDDDIDKPAILKTNLFDIAESNHDTLDSWTPPDNIKVIQLAGWGVKTLSGIKYVEKDDCILGISCVATLDRQPIVSEDGDGTVLSLSATAINTDKYYLNLTTLKQNHTNIFEATSTIEFITDTVLNATGTLPEYISTDKPTSTDKTLELAVHSPVSIDVYDANGNHTGLVNNPSTSSDLEMVEENIPGSRYFDFGEGKYIFLDDNATYTIKLHGLAAGTFTLDANTISAGGNTTDEAQFTDIPTSPDMTGNVIIGASDTGSTTAILDIDTNGDGTDEFHLQPGQNETIPIEATNTEPVSVNTSVGGGSNYFTPNNINISQPAIAKIMPTVEIALNNPVKINKEIVSVQTDIKIIPSASSSAPLPEEIKNDVSVAAVSEASNTPKLLLVIIGFLAVIFGSFLIYKKNRS